MLKQVRFPSLSILMVAASLCLDGCGKKKEAAPVAPPPTAPAVAAPLAAALTVEPSDMLQLGRVTSGEVRRFQYTIRNTSGVPLQVSQVRRSCECAATVRYPRGTIAPGESAVFVFDLAGSKLPPGEFSRKIHVSFAGHPELNTELKFAGILDACFAVRPKADAALGKLPKEDTAWERKFEISGTFAPPQKLVLGPPEHDPSLKVTVVEKGDVHEITVGPSGPLPIGELRERIRIPVVEPSGYPPITLTLHGTVGPRLLARPASLTFNTVKNTAGLAPIPVKVRLSFGVGSGYPVESEDVLVNVPEGVTLLGVTQADDDAIVEVAIQPELLVGKKVRGMGIAVGAARAGFRFQIRDPDAGKGEKEEPPADEE